uniref:Replication initiator protein n=1 Tax=Dulem virus 268 TaxID=3145745 RepID=A0AAU8B4J8_9VIRU
MCLRPLLLKSYGYRDYYANGTATLANRRHTPMVTVPLSRRLYLQSTFNYSYVPCGKCPECVNSRKMSYVQRLVEHCNGRICIFFTLTYKESMIPVIGASDGCSYQYASRRDVSLMFKRIRKDNLLPPFTYFVISEYGHDTHRPHFHGLLYIDIPENETNPTLFGVRMQNEFEALIKTQWKRRVNASQKYPIYEPLSEFIRHYNWQRKRYEGTYDVKFLTPDMNDGSGLVKPMKYVSKYLCKHDPWLEDLHEQLYNTYDYGEYLFIWNNVNPRICASHGIGLAADTDSRISEMVKTSKGSASYYPRYYFSRGDSVSLSRYYRKRYLSLDDRRYFIELNPYTIRNDDGEVVDCVAVYPTKTPDEQRKLWSDYYREQLEMNTAPDGAETMYNLNYL